MHTMRHGKIKTIALGFLVFMAAALPGFSGGARAEAAFVQTDILAIAQSILESSGPEATAAQAQASLPPLDENSFRFSISPILPENQIETVSSYFCMDVSPGHTQTLEIEVKNLGGEPMRITMESTPAITNENGLIQYSAPEDAEILAQNRFTEYVTLSEDAIALAPREAKTVKAEIALPEEGYEGTLLGGLVFVRDQDEAEKKEGGGTAVNSKYSYAMPVQLRMQADALEPSLFVDTVIPNEYTPFGPKTVIRVENQTGAILKPLKLSYTLYGAEDAGTPLVTHEKEPIEMAPMSIMPYAIRQEEMLAPGSYTAKVELTHKGDVYAFDVPFEVPRETPEA